MTSPDPSASPFIAQLDLLMEATLEYTKPLRTLPLSPRGSQEHTSGEGMTTPPHTLDDLDLFLGRVYQIKEWLLHDPQLLHLVDTHMSQQVRKMERRQSIQNLWLSVLNLLAGALLGWMASALAPPLILWHLLIH